MEQGLIHIYCGDGKGKTTAAMGLAIRAAGREKKVFITQFLKSGKSGELVSLEKLKEYITFLPGRPVNKFVWNMNDEEKSLSHYNIGDILITKSGDVLVGTSDGLNIYNPELSI